MRARMRPVPYRNELMIDKHSHRSQASRKSADLIGITSTGQSL